MALWGGHGCRPRGGKWPQDDVLAVEVLERTVKFSRVVLPVLKRKSSRYTVVEVVVHHPEWRVVRWRRGVADRVRDWAVDEPWTVGGGRDKRRVEHLSIAAASEGIHVLGYGT